MKGALQAIVWALLIAVVGVALIDGFATGTSTGENLLNSVGPLILWILPVGAVVNVMRHLFGGGEK